MANEDYITQARNLLINGKPCTISLGCDGVEQGITMKLHTDPDSNFTLVNEKFYLKVLSDENGVERYPVSDIKDVSLAISEVLSYATQGFAMVDVIGVS